MQSALRGMRDGTLPPALDVFSDGGRHQDFLDAVNAYLLPAARDFVTRVKLPVVRDLIVGSMGVSMSSVDLARFPGARVTYGCLEHLVREVPRLQSEYGVPSDRVAGVHAHGGDPTADRWGDERFDLVFLTKKWILAPEDHLGEKFTRKAFDVLRPGGMVVLWECVHPDVGKTSLARAMEAVLDLGASPRGPVATEGGMTHALRRIGFSDVEIVPLLGGELTFVVGRRPR